MVYQLLGAIVSQPINIKILLRKILIIVPLLVVLFVAMPATSTGKRDVSWEVNMSNVKSEYANPNIVNARVATNLYS